MTRPLTPKLTEDEREFCRRIAHYQVVALDMDEDQREIFLATEAARVWTEIQLERESRRSC